MKTDPPNLLELILRKYIEKNRPPEEIRNQLDIGFKLEGQNIELYDIRPRWDNPEEKLDLPFARIKYIKSTNLFKLYWLRASGKWEAYKPFPEATHLQELLDIIDEDKYYCFKG